MIGIIRTLALLATALTLGSTAAQAQNYRSWVASNGDDTKDCSRATPCATFGGALGKTNAGGEITCADSGNFSGATIGKSITINCEGVLGSNGNSTTTLGIFTITTAAADQVILRGLDIDLVIVVSSAINFNGAGTLILDRVKISSAQSGASGILFQPNGAGKLIVSDSIFLNNGGTSTGAGIFIKPRSGGTAQAMLERVNVSGNTYGIAVDGTGSSGVNLTVSNSVVASNVIDGILAYTPSGGGGMGVMIKDTRSVNNGAGIRSIGPNVTVRVDGASVTGNGTGLSFSGGGALLTAGNNMIQGNGTNGSFSGSVALQ